MIVDLIAVRFDGPQGSDVVARGQSTFVMPRTEGPHPIDLALLVVLQPDELELGDSRDICVAIDSPEGWREAGAQRVALAAERINLAWRLRADLDMGGHGKMTTAARVLVDGEQVAETSIVFRCAGLALVS